jgi:hypothetical protein
MFHGQLRAHLAGGISCGWTSEVQPPTQAILVAWRRIGALAELAVQSPSNEVALVSVKVELLRKSSWLDRNTVTRRGFADLPDEVEEQWTPIAQKMHAFR